MGHWIESAPKPQDSTRHEHALRRVAEYFLGERHADTPVIPRRKVAHLEGRTVRVESMERGPDRTFRVVLSTLGSDEQHYCFSIEPAAIRAKGEPLDERAALTEALRRFASRLRNELGLGSPFVGQAEIPRDEDYEDAVLRRARFP